MTIRFAAVDVGYDKEEALAVAVIFSTWEQAEGDMAYRSKIPDVAAYEPGRFYMRELPCVLSVLHRLASLPEIAIVDGYVWLDESLRPGLGALLHDALGRRSAVVGAAKSCFFRGRNVVEVTRGHSRRPLFVTSIGVDLDEAAEEVRKMHGTYRIPTLLAEVDRLSRGIQSRFSRMPVFSDDRS